MNRIDLQKRLDVYGDEYNQKKLEEWYVKELKDTIRSRLSSISTTSSSERRLKERIIKNLPNILVMSPSHMEKYTKAVDSLYSTILVKNKKATVFCKDILDAFNYAGYRYNVLVQLAAWLNVKTCPYCNMSYTLYSEKINPRKKKVPYSDKFARFQFDHFFSKKHYPMLSMSLYNLIPACPTCNQGKSEMKLPIIFNPYHTDIQTLFSFEIDNPLTGYIGARFMDFTPVKIKWSQFVNKTDSDAFEDTFHLSVLYSRHGDIVQEIFDKTYEEPYYHNLAHFRFLGHRSFSYLKRLWYGNYMEKSEIMKRPLSKFTQDIHSQAAQGTSNSGL